MNKKIKAFTLIDKVLFVECREKVLELRILSDKSILEFYYETLDSKIDTSFMQEGLKSN